MNNKLKTIKNHIRNYKENYIKNKSGITLIVLIITVILMLILAGVAISAITGQDALFSKVSDATKEYKKQSLIEAVRTAELHLQLDNTFDKNIEINMSNLIDKLKEISEVNEKDYIISDIEVNPETGAETVTIADKKTGVVLDITKDTNGKVTIETSIVDDISKVTRPVIELTLDPEEGTYAETVIIKVTVTEEVNGIVKIQIPDENLTVNTYNNEKEVTFDFPVTENSTYTFVAENANGRKTTKSIEVKNTMSVRDITIENLGGEVTKSSTNIKISYDANPRIGGQVLTNTNKYQYIIGTESETNIWKTANTTIEEETGLAVATIPVNENGKIHARYFDGTTGHKTTTLNIQNIDNEKPEEFSITANPTVGKETYSVTVTTATGQAVKDKGSTGTAEGNIKIKGYQFQIKDSNGNIIKIKDNNGTANLDWSTLQEGISYTFDNQTLANNLRQCATYTVIMRAVDLAGNYRDANTTAQVTGIPNSETAGIIGIKYVVDGVESESLGTPTKNNVIVKFTNNSGNNNLTLKYQIGATNDNGWKTYPSTGVEMSTNGTVYARLYDAAGQSQGVASANVNNIDKEVPKITTATASTSWGQTNSVTLKATDAGSTNCATSNYGIIGYGINQSTETEPTYTECNATISLNTEIKNITANGTYVVWVKDKAGNTAKTQVTINKVDTLAPKTATLEVLANTITSTTFTLKATGAEATATNTSGASGISKYEFYIKNADGTFKLEKTIESTNTTENYAVSGKAAGTTYTYKVIVYDAVGKSKTSSEITVTTEIVSVKLADGMVPVVYNNSDSSWYVATETQVKENTWYEYVDTSETGKANTSKWANVMLKDNLVVSGVANAKTTTLSQLYGKKVTSEGSMFVWIPRYAYKITSNLHNGGSGIAGDIDVVFIDTNNKNGNKTYSTTYPTTTDIGTATGRMNDYVVHPAFSWEKEDGTPVELEGIWIGKFEASGADASFAAKTPGNVETSSSVILRSVGNVTSWRSIIISNMFLNCYNMNNSTNASIYGISTNKDIIDSHLMKNTEWGAAAYIAHSKYGRNGVEVTINSGGFSTGKGDYKTNVTLSTTGNIYGIYDMIGGAMELVAAYLNNSHSRLTTYGSALVSGIVADKYIDVYEIGTTDDHTLNYARTAERFGDALYETSYGAGYYSSSEDIVYGQAHSGWQYDTSCMPIRGVPFLARGGAYTNSPYAGLFYFSNQYGAANSYHGYRPCIVTM